MYYIKSPSLSVGLASSKPSPCPSPFIPQWTNQMSIQLCYKLSGRLQNFCKIQCESSVLLVKSKKGSILEISTGVTMKSTGSGCSCRSSCRSPSLGITNPSSGAWQMSTVLCNMGHIPTVSWPVYECPLAFWVSLTGNFSLTGCINLAALASWLPTLLQLFLSPPGPA